MATYKKVMLYDSEPVKFCTKCLSLKVLYEDIRDIEYCGECGCTDVEEAPLDVWEQKYEKKYGHKFVEKGTNPRNSYIFNLTNNEIKQRLFASENWRKAIETIYPYFPRGYSKIDTILLFWDKILKDNKLDDFKLELTKIKL